jgi:hypothetical protein
MLLLAPGVTEYDEDVYTPPPPPPPDAAKPPPPPPATIKIFVDVKRAGVVHVVTQDCVPAVDLTVTVS